MAIPMTRPAEAHPRPADEIRLLPACAEAVDEAQRRAVTEVVHFTTIHGVVGVLAKGAVKSRMRLPTEDYLKHVYRPNSRFRKDVAWLDYVNLSVSRINDWMFDTSERWHVHDGVSWAVLSFTADILGHPGVVFATTNNIYPSCRRAEGLAGFSRMFDDPILGRYNRVHTRAGLPTHFTTDRQAEVLYPGALAIAHLQRIDVQVEGAIDDVEGALGGLGLRVPVRLAPEVFE